MGLNNNEKKVVEILIENARTSDIKIAKELKISSQAVGKIRRKIESEMIESYSLKLKNSKIGIAVFSVSKSKITKEGLDKGELEVEEILKKSPNIVCIYRFPNSIYTYLITYGFEDMEEMDEFFYSEKNKQNIFKYIENLELNTFSHNSLIKNDYKELYKKILKNKEKNKEIKEIENFKKKVNNNGKNKF